MFERILKIMREKTRTRQYVITLHAEEEMDDEGVTIFDIERGILTAEVIKHHKDQNTAESIYLLKGQTIGGNQVVVTKLSATDKLVIITVYLE